MWAKSPPTPKKTSNRQPSTWDIRGCCRTQGVVLRDPVVDGGAAGKAHRVRRTAGGRRRRRGRARTERGRGYGDGGLACGLRCEPAKGRASPRHPPRGPRGRGRSARHATTDRAPRGGCSALRAERLLLLVCNDRFRGHHMHKGRYLHSLVTPGVNSLSGNWALATVSALLRRRATTVGGTVVTVR